MNKNLLMITSFIIFSLFNAFSQFNLKDKDTWSKELINLTTSESDSMIVYFRKDLKMDALNFFKNEKKSIGFGGYSDMKLIRKSVDLFGDADYDFQQTYKGIPIEGVHYKLHEKDGYLYSGNGTMINLSGLEYNVDDTVSIDYVLKNSSFFKDGIDVSRIKAKKVFYKKQNQGSISVDNIILAYQIRAFDDQTKQSFSLFFNASTGVFLYKFANSSNCMTAGVDTYFNGRQIFNVVPVNLTGNQWLVDNCRGHGIHTYNDYNKWENSGEEVVSQDWGKNYQSEAT